MALRGPLADDVIRLGPAITSFPIVGAVAVDGLLAVVSRNVNPARVALLDLEAEAAEAVVEVPTGDGAWGVAVDGAALWLGMFGARGRANLYRLDVASGELRTAAAIDAVHLWDLAIAADGTVYGASDGPAGLFAFDPQTWLAVDLQVVDTGPELARSVAVVGGHVIVGGRRDQRAMLRAVDPRTRATRDILPPELAEHGIVYALASAGDVLAIGTRGPGEQDPAVAVLDLAGLDSGQVPRTLGIATVPDASVVDGLLVEPDDVWATVRPSGALVRTTRSGAAPETVAEPVPLAEQRGIVRLGGDLVGASGDGSVWRVQEDGAVVVTDLVGDGVVAGAPETVQSLAAGPGRVWAGGTFGVARRDGRGALVRTAVPGEPKAMVEVDEVLHLALYPIGEVWSLASDGVPERLAALPVEENRPLALVHAPGPDVLLVGTAADRAGGGGFHVVDRTSGRRAGARNPIDAAQRVSRIALAAEDLALLGGTRDGAVVAWALDEADDAADAGREVWRLDAPAPDGGAVAGLAVLEGHAHLLTAAGWHVVIDLGARTVAHRARIGDSGGGLVVAAGRVWGVDADRLLRFDGSEVAVRLEGLAPRHWSHPTLAADGDDLLVIDGTDVIRVGAASA